MGLKLIRTLTTLGGALPADPDWAGGLLSPGFDPLNVIASNTKAVFLFRGFDNVAAPVALGDMEFDFTSVVAMPIDASPPTTHLAQFFIATAANGMRGKSLALEVDLPSYAVAVYPRIVSAGVNVPGTLDSLEIWGGIYQ